MILLLSVLCFADGTKAQSVTNIGGTSQTDANSPSITSFRGDQNNLVCAYVAGSAIHVATSTNNGQDWNDPTGNSGLATPSGMNAMDEPQILSDWNGEDVSLVARGYDDASWKGQGYQIAEFDAGTQTCNTITPASAGLSHTLYTHAGIYYAHSTDGGQHWSGWTPIVTLNSTNETVDHPRIAFRRDYADWVNDVPGVITWEDRTLRVSVAAPIRLMGTQIEQIF